MVRRPEARMTTMMKAYTAAARKTGVMGPSGLTDPSITDGWRTASPNRDVPRNPRHPRNPAVPGPLAGRRAPGPIPRRIRSPNDSPRLAQPRNGATGPGEDCRVLDHDGEQWSSWVDPMGERDLRSRARPDARADETGPLGLEVDGDADNPVGRLDPEEERRAVRSGHDATGRRLDPIDPGRLDVIGIEPERHLAGRARADVDLQRRGAEVTAEAVVADQERSSPSTGRSAAERALAEGPEQGRDDDEGHDGPRDPLPGPGHPLDLGVDGNVEVPDPFDRHR